MEFFDRCRSAAFDCFVSVVVLEEIERAAEPIRSDLRRPLIDISPTVLEASPEVEALAGAFVEAKVVPQSKPEDARHVAAAFVHDLDVLVSWNFRHIASLRRAERFNAVAVLQGYSRPLRIVSPAELLYDE